MDMGWVAAIVTALGGLFGLFFGRSHWKMLEKLVDSQAKRIEYQKSQLEALRFELDKTEQAYHTCVSEVQIRERAIDRYTSSIRKLTLENKRLRGDGSVSEAKQD